VSKAKIDVTIKLNKNNCYFLRTGKCSLNVVDDFSMAGSLKIPTNDLLYCPKLYKTMCTKKEQMRPITVALCECEHGEVLSGHQRACIASQRNMPLQVRASNEAIRPTCTVCGGQMTFDTESKDSGARIVTLHALAIHDDEENSGE
jgi:hypothetical protein